MRRTILVLAAMLVTLVVASGLAWAGTIECVRNATCWGTRYDDDMYGTDGRDGIYGLQGTDAVYAYQENDRVHGGHGNDTIYGDAQNRRGGWGHDLVDGGPGDDDLQAWNGNDQYYGGEGDDYIDVGEFLRSDSKVFSDYVNCGPGYDTVINYTRGHDTLKYCEVVER